MQNSIRVLFYKLLHKQSFVSYWAILMIDSFLSTFATLVTLLFVGNFIEHISMFDYLLVLPLSFIISILLFSLFKIERKIIRHSTIKSMSKVIQAIFVKELALLFIISLFNTYFHIHHTWVCAVIDFSLTTLCLILLRLALIVVYDLAVSKFITPKTRVLIYGTDNNSVSLCKRLYASTRHSVLGFISMDAQIKKGEICDRPIYYFADEAAFAAFVIQQNVKSILFTSYKDIQSESDRLLAYAERLNLKTLISPPIGEYDANAKPTMREVKIEDLLGRDEININMQAIHAHFADKVVMVTGAAGSIGSELCRQLATFGIQQLILFDNAETPMHEFRLELERTFPMLTFVPFIGDVRQQARLSMAFKKYNPQVVFHAAAYKHVPLMEENPCEAVRANVVGSRLVADLCVQYGVEEMVMVSTDKAVNPTNVMGCSKRLAEIYIQSLGIAIERGEVQGRTRFVTTRFGNVLGSNGSVIPHFRKQIESGGPVTVTHPDINRFFMTIPEACRLVMDAASMNMGNKIFVFDMGEPVKIIDLAERMIRLAGFVPYQEMPITFTGLRPGEKLYEELLSDEENTIPTDHHKIRIAQVRDYHRSEILPLFDQLDNLAMAVEVDDTVRMMKQIVPEFKSKNSVYEKLDKEIEATLMLGVENEVLKN